MKYISYSKYQRPPGNHSIDHQIGSVHMVNSYATNLDKITVNGAIIGTHYCIPVGKKDSVCPKAWNRFTAWSGIWRWPYDILYRTMECYCYRWCQVAFILPKRTLASNFYKLTSPWRINSDSQMYHHCKLDLTTSLHGDIGTYTPVSTTAQGKGMNLNHVQIIYYKIIFLCVH